MSHSTYSAYKVIVIDPTQLNLTRGVKINLNQTRYGGGGMSNSGELGPLPMIYSYMYLLSIL